MATTGPPDAGMQRRGQAGPHSSGAYDGSRGHSGGGKRRTTGSGLPARDTHLLTSSIQRASRSSQHQSISPRATALLHASEDLWEACVLAAPPAGTWRHVAPLCAWVTATSAMCDDCQREVVMGYGLVEPAEDCLALPDCSSYLLPPPLAVVCSWAGLLHDL
jgi:hypothetical protein